MIFPSCSELADKFVHSSSDVVESSLTAAFIDVSLGPNSELLGDLGQSLERIGLVESEFFVFDLSSFSLKDLSWLAVGSKIWVWVWTTVGQRRVVEATVCSAVSTEHVGGHFVHSNRPSNFDEEGEKSMENLPVDGVSVDDVLGEPLFEVSCCLFKSSWRFDSSGFLF